MRAIASSLAGMAMIAMIAFSGGAWIPSSDHVPYRIPPNAAPFPALNEVRSIVDMPVAVPERTLHGCQVPLSAATCNRISYRETNPIELDPYLLVPESVSSPQDWRPLVERFFAVGDVERALDVIACESGGDPNAKNPSSSASGLFQHLASEWDRRAYGAGWYQSDIFDPVANVAVAAWLVYEGGGWSHWSASGRCW